MDRSVGAMVTAQTGEIVQMECLPRQLGGTPLPPPDDFFERRNERAALLGLPGLPPP